MRNGCELCDIRKIGRHVSFVYVTYGYAYVMGVPEMMELRAGELRCAQVYNIDSLFCVGKVI